LESVLDRYTKLDKKRAEQLERMLKKMRNKIKDEELKMLKGEIEIDESELDNEVLNKDIYDRNTHKRPLGVKNFKSEAYGDLRGPQSDEDDEGSEGDDFSNLEDDSQEISVGGSTDDMIEVDNQEMSDEFYHGGRNFPGNENDF